MFQKTFQKLSGGKRVPFPKDVWSPTGGWYSNPRNWKRNTALLLFGSIFTYIGFMKWMTRIFVLIFFKTKEVDQYNEEHKVPNPKFLDYYDEKGKFNQVQYSYYKNDAEPKEYFKNEKK